MALAEYCTYRTRRWKSGSSRQVLSSILWSGLPVFALAKGGGGGKSGGGGSSSSTSQGGNFFQSADGTINPLVYIVCGLIMAAVLACIRFAWHFWTEIRHSRVSNEALQEVRTQAMIRRAGQAIRPDEEAPDSPTTGYAKRAAAYLESFGKPSEDINKSPVAAGGGAPPSPDAARVVSTASSSPLNSTDNSQQPEVQRPSLNNLAGTRRVSATTGSGMDATAPRRTSLSSTTTLGPSKGATDMNTTVRRSPPPEATNPSFSTSSLSSTQSATVRVKRELTANTFSLGGNANVLPQASSFSAALAKTARIAPSPSPPAAAGALGETMRKTMRSDDFAPAKSTLRSKYRQTNNH